MYTLVSAQLNKQSPLPEFTGPLCQRQFFTSSVWNSGCFSYSHPWKVWITIRFYCCKRSLIDLWVGRVPLTRKMWIKLLALFPAQVRLKDGLHSCLGSLLQLTRQFGLGTTISFLHWRDTRTSPRAIIVFVLGLESGLI